MSKRLIVLLCCYIDYCYIVVLLYCCVVVIDPCGMDGAALLPNRRGVRRGSRGANFSAFQIPLDMDNSEKVWNVHLQSWKEVLFFPWVCLGKKSGKIVKKKCRVERGEGGGSSP